jgi:hypothetical protein
VQVHQQIGLGSVLKCAVGHLLGGGPAGLASQRCLAGSAEVLAAARVRSPAATPGAWRTNGPAARVSQSSIHSSTCSARTPDQVTAGFASFKIQDRRTPAS